MSFRMALLVLIFILLGGMTGHALTFLPVPLPYFLGPMILSGCLVSVLPKALMDGVTLPDPVRLPFIATIGLMIGAQVHVEMITDWPAMVVLMVALIIFVPLAQIANYLMFRKIGGYDRATAFYGGTPGGLIEALAFGEKAGADIALLTVQQFLRIVIVVTVLPFIISVWVGHPVGSAAGLASLSAGTSSPFWLIALIVVSGIVLGRTLRLPAGQLTGALLLAATLTAIGWVELIVPNWLVALSQIVIGTGLGLKFNGLPSSVLRRGIGMAVLSSLVMLSIALALAWGVHRLSALQIMAAFLSFAPGGINEMSLVALSLSADAAIVTVAHVWRIALAVVMMRFVQNRISRPPSPRG